jgi:hypothetical protein
MSPAGATDGGWSIGSGAIRDIEGNIHSVWPERLALS